MDEVPDEDAAEEPDSTPEAALENDEDQAIIEDVLGDEKEEKPAPKTKSVLVEEWVQLNVQPPVWARCVVIVSCSSSTRS